MSNNFEKELQMYFYNKGYGSESGKEAADMAAFLQEHQGKEINLFDAITDKIMTILFILLLFAALGIGISYIEIFITTLLKIVGGIK